MSTNRSESNVLVGTRGVLAGLVLWGFCAASGQMYTTPQHLVSGTPGVEKARVAADGDVALAVWEQRDASGDFWDIFYARTVDRGATWSAPVKLTNTVGTAEPLTDNVRPRVATANGRWIIVYSDKLKNIREGDIEAFVSDDVETTASAAAITWTGPIQVHSDGGANDEDADPDIATDGAGNWLVVWDKVYEFSPIANNASDIWGAFSTDDGLTWSASFKVTDMPGDAVAATATEDGDPGVAYGAGQWVVCFKSGDATAGPQQDEDVFITHTTTPTGVWSAPVNIHPWGSSDAGDDDNPSIAFSAQDNVFLVAWNSEENFAGSGTDADIMVASASGANVNVWTVLGVVNDGAGDVGPDESPALAADAFGTVVATWGSDEDGAGDWDVDYAISADGGITWAVRGTVAVGAGNDDATESTTEASAAGTFYTVFQGGTNSATISVLDLAGTIGGGGGVITANRSLIQEGDYVTLTAPAGGTNYRWFRNGGPMVNGVRISGVDTQVLVFDPVSDADSAIYTVEYDDGSKAVVVSAPFHLQVLPAGSLPATGAVALAFVAGLLLAGALLMIRRLA